MVVVVVVNKEVASEFGRMDTTAQHRIVMRVAR